MQRSYKVHCLLSENIWGEMVGLNKKNFSNSSAVLVTKVLTTDQVQKIINNPSVPAAVLVEKGSFAGHPSVMLNGKGIQLISIEKLPKGFQQYYAFVNGKTERMYLSKSVDDIVAMFNNMPKNNKTFETPTSKVLYKGEEIRVNVDGKCPMDLGKGIEMGSSGVGILRTEWLGWEDSNPPSAETHMELYAECLKVLGKKRLNIRLFDIGGDKIPGWAGVAKQEIRSPLGLRGIRSSKILKTAFDNQIRAVGKISEHVSIGVVLPMISDPSEISEFKTYFYELNRDIKTNIVWGSMVETPSAGLMINDIFKYADFVRIGPGDLSQFTLATIRENITPDYLSGDNLHPAVIKIIRKVMIEAKRQGKEANMCLDVEPRKPLLKKLLSAGVRTFNVSPANVPVTFSLIEEIGTELY